MHLFMQYQNISKKTKAFLGEINAILVENFG
jgi:hypothetical protein